MIITLPYMGRMNRYYNLFKNKFILWRVITL